MVFGDECYFIEQFGLCPDKLRVRIYMYMYISYALVHLSVRTSMSVFASIVLLAAGMAGDLWPTLAGPLFWVNEI